MRYKRAGESQANLDSHPLNFHLSSDGGGDGTKFEMLPDIGHGICSRVAMMNMRYDRQANQAAACARCVTPVFLRRKNSRKHLYAIPVCIKQTNLKLERFRRVATRCDSIHISYSAIISLAHGLAMAKPLRTA